MRAFGTLERSVRLHWTHRSVGSGREDRTRAIPSGGTARRRLQSDTSPPSLEETKMCRASPPFHSQRAVPAILLRASSSRSPDRCDGHQHSSGVCMVLGQTRAMRRKVPRGCGLSPPG